MTETLGLLTVVDDQPFAPRALPTRADRVFRFVTTMAGMVSLLVVVLTLVFMVDKARPAFHSSGVVGYFTHSTWTSASGKFGVLGLAENTLIISLVALCIGVPVALGMAVFINEYAPWRVRQVMTSAIDLLAAMPSLLFGIWGLQALEGPIVKVATWLSQHLSVLPIFRLGSNHHGTLTGSTFQAGAVVGIMIIPIVTSISRDVMSQVPRDQCEGAALALGGTRWGMVRDVILPFGRSGIVGGILLGLGRALGETIAILFIVSQVVAVNTNILTQGSGSIASWIAVNFNGSTPLNRSGLVAAGLTLFLLTFLVNMAARIIVSRSERFRVTVDDVTPTAPVPVADVDRYLADDQRYLADRPRRQPRMSREDFTDLASAFLAGAAGAGLLRTVLGWHGDLGTGVWWYVTFVAAYYLLQRDGATSEVGLDRVVTVLIWSAGVAVVAVLTWMLAFVAERGYHRLSLGFFTHDMATVGPLDPGGGVRAAIIGSAEQVGLATLAVVPVAILTAVYLHELRGRLAGVVRFAVNALAGTPSIVAGLVVFTVWVIAGHGPSGAAGSAALAILMLPFVTRTAEEVLHTVPDSLREASLALGAPQWRVVLRVVLPTALAGLTTAVILGVALGVGETAPLLLTTSYANGTVTDPFHGPQSSLAYFVYTYLLEPNKVQNQRGYTALLVLVILVLVLFVLARFVGRRSERRLGRSR